MKNTVKLEFLLEFESTCFKKILIEELIFHLKNHFL